MTEFDFCKVHKNFKEILEKGNYTKVSIDIYDKHNAKAKAIQEEVGTNYEDPCVIKIVDTEETYAMLVSKLDYLK